MRTNTALLALVVTLSFAHPARAQFYRQTNLVSDLPSTATVTDPLLVNPWGMSHSSMSPFWVSDAGTKKATLYAVDGTTGAVSKVGLEVTIPAAPSGQVFNGSMDFVVTQGGASGPAAFLFAGLNGTILGWNHGVPPPVPPATISTQAELAATGAPPPAAYTGIALANRGMEQFLYAANNAAGRIDVFDKTFTKVTLPGTFTDPNLPAGDMPFNIVNLGGSLYVAYSGPTGVVNRFDTDGKFVQRFATGGTLFNPWGITMAPADFGEFSNAVLIGNFNNGNHATGQGWISAFDVHGNFLGRLEGADKNPLSIDGLWTLEFGNGQSGGISNVLYFSAGIQNQMHGLVGSLSACHGPSLSDVSASPNSLWPPNHKFVHVAIGYNVADDCDPAPACTLSVSSNEGEGHGSGHTSPDWQVLDAHDVELRAERDGKGDGRVYTVSIGCTDTLGLTSNAATHVTVAHDHGKKK